MKRLGLKNGSIMAVVNSKSAANVVSGFYPAPQRGKIKSATVLSRGPDGRTYRPVAYEMASVLETHKFRKKGWVGSPYENTKAVKVKQKTSKMLAAIITSKPKVIKRLAR